MGYNNVPDDVLHQSPPSNNTAGQCSTQAGKQKICIINSVNHSTVCLFFCVAAVRFLHLILVLFVSNSTLE